MQKQYNTITIDTLNTFVQTKIKEDKNKTTIKIREDYYSNI